MTNPGSENNPPDDMRYTDRFMLFKCKNIIEKASKKKTNPLNYHIGFEKMKFYEKKDYIYNMGGKVNNK